MIKGNLLSVTEGILLHQCNCQGNFGAGLALQIKHKWPHVAEASEKLCRLSSPLGHTQLVQINEKLWVANIYGQFHYGRGHRQTDYVAVSRALWELKGIANEKEVFAPKNMGCGLAGGVWTVYLGILETVFPNITIIEFER
jgi:O-acetyl-ADP-ribose deacetylase (regulator of RNase III)